MFHLRCLTCHKGERFACLFPCTRCNKVYFCSNRCRRLCPSHGCTASSQPLISPPMAIPLYTKLELTLRCLEGVYQSFMIGKSGIPEMPSTCCTAKTWSEGEAGRTLLNRLLRRGIEVKGSGSVVECPATLAQRLGDKISERAYFSFMTCESVSVWIELEDREELKFWRLVGKVEKRGKSWWGELNEGPQLHRVEEEVRRGVWEIADDLIDAPKEGKSWMKWVGRSRAPALVKRPT